MFRSAVMALMMVVGLAACSYTPPTLVSEQVGEVVNVKSYSETKRNLVAGLAGGAAGGFLGSKIGGGSGKKVATTVGAVGGAAAASQAASYEVIYFDYDVRLESGMVMRFTKREEQGRFQPGQKVVVATFSDGSRRLN